MYLYYTAIHKQALHINNDGFLLTHDFGGNQFERWVELEGKW